MGRTTSLLYRGEIYNIGSGPEFCDELERGYIEAGEEKRRNCCERVGPAVAPLHLNTAIMSS